MAAVKSPYGVQALFQRPFSPIPDSPWPNSAMTPSTSAAHGNMFQPTRQTSGQPASQVSATARLEDPPTPQDITAPSPSTSETSTVFTDLDGDEGPRSAQPEEDQPAVLNFNLPQTEAVKSPANLLKIDTIALNPGVRAEEDEPPQSVIHVPSSFARFHTPHGTRQSSRLSQTYTAPRSQRSLSNSSAASNRTEPAPTSTQSGLPSQVAPPTERSVSTVSGVSTASAASTTTTESTVPSEATVRPDIEAYLADGVSDLAYEYQMAASPLHTLSLTSKDWASTPRAQTRQELSFSRPGSSLASIREGDDDDQSEAFEPSADELDAFSRKRASMRKTETEIQALEDALAECWTLCNTLQNLSNRHRDRMFLHSRSNRADMHEKAWKSCWKLCQNLYDPKDTTAIAGTKNTLSLCREFCQTLFEVRIRKDDAADSVLRVSFELNNHLFNTHDRTLPEAFRERTLDFYVTLCHRLMKQKSKMAEETDALLRACWTLAEMLFSIRQSRRENRKPDQELLGSAMQACWDLCDIFREGWTQIRPDRGTPRATQATFSQAFQLARRQGYIEDQHTLKITPETPTTIFDDTATISPEEAPVPTISVMDHGVPQSAKSTASAPPALPRPNTTQRVSRSTMAARHQAHRWGSINEVVSEDETPSRPASALSQDSRASSHVSMASSLASSQHTIRTPSEDPSLTLLKALFVRAAVQTNRGFSADPRNSNGRDATYNSLPMFVRSLPENAFGGQVWQRNLLEHYKKAVAQDSTFKHLGSTASAIGVGPDPEKGKEEIAIVLKGMVDNSQGWAWLRDLFRYGYGMHIEDVVNKSKEVPSAPTDAKQPSLLKNNTRNQSSVSSSNTGADVNGQGNEGRKISPPRR